MPNRANVALCGQASQLGIGVRDEAAEEVVKSKLRVCVCATH